MMDSIDYISLILGLASAILLIALARRFSWKAEKRFWAFGLVIAAIIYILFALRSGIQTNWLVIEGAGILLFGSFAILGLRKHPAWIGIGWMSHSLWDYLLHHHFAAPAFVPDGYAMACLSFDIVVGLYILLQSDRWQRRWLFS